MKEIYFVQEFWYPRSSLQLFTDGDLRKLVANGILINESDSKYKFIFVGIISLRELVFVIISKILKNENFSLPEARITIQTLKKYAYGTLQRFDGIDYFEVDPDMPHCAEIAIAEFLIRDFHIHGFYNIEEEIIQADMAGDVDWPLTVLNTEPIFSNGQPIYESTINRSFINDAKNLIVELHKWSVQRSIKKYSILLGEDFGEIDFDCDEDLGEIGTSEQLTYLLENQLHHTFTDRGIRIIKSIIFLISSRAAEDPESLSLYGTKNYENVWEAICKSVINNIYPALAKNYNFFPNPVWQILGKEYLTKSILIPDIVAHNRLNGRYHLYDAKYYLIGFEGSLTGIPGYKDVLKQFQYHEHLENYLGKVENGFLFPISNTKFSQLKQKDQILASNDFMAVIGHVSYDLYPGRKIAVIVCPFSLWQQMFIDSKAIESSLIL